MRSKDPSAISASLGNFDALPACAYVRLPTVCGLYDISEPTAWRWVKSGRIPAPKKIGPRVSGWNVGELRADLRAKAA